MRIECFSQPNKRLDADLYYCGYEDCCDGFSAGPFKKNDFLIHFVVKGKGYFKLGEKVHEVKKGDYFIIFPGQIVFYWSEEKPAWSFAGLRLTEKKRWNIWKK